MSIVSLSAIDCFFSENSNQIHESAVHEFKRQRNTLSGDAPQPRAAAVAQLNPRSVEGTASLSSTPSNFRRKTDLNEPGSILWQTLWTRGNHYVMVVWDISEE